MGGGRRLGEGAEAAGAAAAVAAGAGEASESSESEQAFEDVTAAARAAMWGWRGKPPAPGGCSAVSRRRRRRRRCRSRNARVVIDKAQPRADGRAYALHWHQALHGRARAATAAGVHWSRRTGPWPVPSSAARDEVFEFGTTGFW